MSSSKEFCLRKIKDYTLVLLNSSACCKSSWFNSLWNGAKFRIAVDGAANALCELQGEGKLATIPTCITGDFDSAKPEALQLFKSLGSEVIHTPDQNHTDFTKSLEIVRTKGWGFPICVFSSDTLDRADHVFACFNTLLCASRWTGMPPVYLMNSSCLTLLVPPGSTRLLLPPAALGSPCGLLPLTGSADSVTTDGLQWPLMGQRLAYGELISTSNEVTSEVINVDTSAHLIFTAHIDPITSLFDTV